MGKKNVKKRLVDTQPQLTRIHALVKRIQKGDFPSQKILAKEWEKNPRTIQRDMDYMRDFLGLPLAYDENKYGYYFTEPVSRFPMVSVSERELVSVFVAQKALRLYHGTPFERPLKAAFEKLVGGLKGEISVAWADLDSAISFRGIEANPSDAKVFQELSGAVRTRNEIEFEYRKLGEGGAPGKSELRRVQPYHLGCVANQWYLFGYDLARKDMRKFVPARMSNVRVVEQRFERPENFSVDKILKGSFTIYSGGREVMPMRIWFDSWAGQLVKERKWHRSQKVRDLKNGEVEMTLELSSFVEIVPWILGWGNHARALAPKGLVEEVRKVVKELGKMYTK